MALLTALFSVFGIFGCKKSEPFPADPSAEPAGLSFSCSSMSMTDSYSFAIYKTDGKNRFDADYYLYDKEKRIVFEGKDVSDDDMRAALDIIEKYDLVGFLSSYKESKSKVAALDGTKYYLGVTMSDGSRRQVGSANDARTALYDFFTALAVKTADDGDFQ